MELSPYVAALRENLTAAAAAGDEQTRTAARVLAATIEPAARLAIMNALADLAGEVTLALEDRVVEVRLDGQDVQVVVTGAPTDDHEPVDDPPPTMGDPTGDISRITVRLLEELKTKAEEAASARGVSLNSFVQQAVQGALRERARGGRGRGPGGGAGPWGGGNPWAQGMSGGAWSPFGDAGKHNDDDRPGRGGRGSSRVRGWVEG
ncbi:MAG TPA: YlcI/YnfO family protein [Mycobacteriales bacterium]|nr:YlcI/YnfO family protein [Mycobacteriales bacterium]